jgi:putative GTP pyrophosphokinase
MTDKHQIQEACEKLEKSYHIKKENYTLLCEEILKQINKLVNDQQVKLAMPVDYRIKEWNSLLNKSKKWSPHAEDVSEINDVAGLRIITLFDRDIVKVCDVIESHFEICRKEDTRNRLGENQFGYGSIHYEIFLKDEWLALPTLKTLEGYKAEIQVRTASQNIWAAASHTLQYKREEHVPLPLKRSINRIAAILELVDIEFERLLAGREKYVEDINQFPSEVTNVNLLEKLLDYKLPSRNKVGNENYSHVLDALKFLNLTNTKDLGQFIDDNLEGALIDDEHMLKLILEGGPTAYKSTYYETQDGLVCLNHTDLLENMFLFNRYMDYGDFIDTITKKEI